MAEENTNEQGNTEFGIQRLYVKDLSWESPKAPEVFLQDWKPELHMDLGTQSARLDDEHHEVVLTVSVKVQMGEDVVFLVEVQQAGIFMAKGFKDEELKPMLGSFCPSVLYPYAREAVTDLVVRGGFPQLYLAPVNFDALYHQHEQQEQAKDKQEA